MPPRDLKFLFFGVTGEPDHFHAVAQGGLDRIEHVCCRHEHGVREIEDHAEIVVAEAVVLFRVEHFEQRRRRVAAKVRTDLVNLVEHDERVVCAHLLQSLNDPAGHRADISAPVAAYLRFVVQTAQREPNEFSIKRARNRTTQRGFTDAGRADQTQDRSLRSLLQLAHRQRFDDALFDFLQAVMIFIENLLRFFEIEVINRSFRPRQVGHDL